MSAGTSGEYIADWDAIPAEYQDAVAHCYALGVIKGFEDGSFSGGETLTRAQVCVVMMGMEQAVAGTDTQLDTPETKPQVPDEDTGLADVPPGVLTDDGTVAANTNNASKTKVAYGSAKYPSLSNPDANTFRKLDYIEDGNGRATYFYDFRNTWYAAHYELPEDIDAATLKRYPDSLTKLYNDRQGFYGRIQYHDWECIGNDQ
ncbi:MAG: S-layer homology domain-containing protein [Oscillospiraceae bacterium]|nr:S-layer homology domain-containing protein [Oscillospiraceae bacterium]